MTIVPLASAAQSPQPAGGTVRGLVVDAATGSPLSRVLVLDERSGASVVTGADGTFRLELPAGVRPLRASVVGYAVTVREVTVGPGRVIEVTLPLAGGTGGYAEDVTVTGGRFRSADPGAPAQQVLGSADIQNLRGVLADDPLRAVQVLPGVATGDDLRSEFSVRGSSFAHIHLGVDGFTTPYLLHAVRAVEDASSSGSIAMINSDILQDVSLVSGGYVQRSGDRTGASVEFHVRSGSRERTQVRAAVSGTNASIVAEGPLGPAGARRGSWLVSGRQSYLDLLIERLVQDQVQFGFSDTQGKLQYDLSPQQRVEATVIAGRSRLREPREEVDANDLYIGSNASVVGIGTWRRTSGQTIVTTGILAGINRFRNQTLFAAELDRGHERQLAVRADVKHQARGSLSVDAGGEVDVFWESRRRQRPVGSTTFRAINDYTGDAARVGAYGALRWSMLPSLTLMPGARVDRWSLTGQTTFSPWLQAEWRAGSRTTVRGAAGTYQQFARFEQVLGAWGTPGLAPERALHADLSLERTIGDSARVQITLYDREERDFLRRPGAEPRLVNGQLVRGFTSATFENRLTGSARGVELFAQRLDANGFSGWVSYAYGQHRYRDTVTGEAFWGDLDQRHTVNLYGLYRLSPRMSVSAKLRIGSNVPAPGYYREEGGRYFVSDVRNEVRLPEFARLDLRVNRTFTWSTRRLTLFAELINVLNRENMRYHPPSIDARTFEARRLFESLLPVVPSAGVLIEF
jgi:TonB dependent receptor/CarboxypepD_reg-like domain